MYICICNAVTERQVRECVKRGACSIEELAGSLGLGAGCGRCIACAAEVIKEVREHQEPERPAGSEENLTRFGEPSAA